MLYNLLSSVTNDAVEQKARELACAMAGQRDEGFDVLPSFSLVEQELMIQGP